jgi:hypothetical protein
VFAAFLYDLKNDSTEKKSDADSDKRSVFNMFIKFDKIVVDEKS